MDVPRVDRCRPAIAPSIARASSRRKRRRGSRRSCSTKLDAYQIPPDKRADAEERVAQLKQHSGAPQRHSQSVAHASEARTVRRVGVAASAARIRMHRLPSRPGSRHRVRPRRTHPRQPQDGAPLGSRRRRHASFPGRGTTTKRHWGYEENPFIETPMYPRQYYEAGCIKCHSGQVSVRRRRRDHEGDGTPSSSTAATPATRSTTGASPIFASPAPT